jgi:hypothetical protein
VPRVPWWWRRSTGIAVDSETARRIWRRHRSGRVPATGNDMSYGGPLVGFMACKQEFIWPMPGRLVSATKDVDGRDASRADAAKPASSTFGAKRRRRTFVMNQGLLGHTGHRVHEPAGRTRLHRIGPRVPRACAQARARHRRTRRLLLASILGGRSSANSSSCARPMPMR